MAKFFLLVIVFGLAAEVSSQSYPHFEFRGNVLVNNSYIDVLVNNSYIVCGAPANIEKHIEATMTHYIV